MNKNEIYKIASGHWTYTKGIIVGSHEYRIPERIIELMRYLYVEAFVHGYKHSQEEKENE